MGKENGELRGEVEGLKGEVEGLKGGVRGYEEKIKKLEFDKRDRRVLSSECVKLEGKLKDMESYFIKNESKKKLKGLTKKDNACQTEIEGCFSS